MGTWGPGGGTCGCEIRGRANGLGAHLTGGLHVPSSLTHANQKARGGAGPSNGARSGAAPSCAAYEAVVPFYAFLFIGRSADGSTLILALEMCGRTAVPRFRLLHLACWQNSFSKIVGAWTRYLRRP